MSNAFSNQVGVTAEEQVTNALSIGSNLSTRNIGLAVARERGIPNKPVRVTGLKEDKRRFGDHSPNMYSSYVVENLLNNTGGFPVNLFQMRLVGQGSAAAKVVVRNQSLPNQTVSVQTTQNASTTQAQKTRVSVANAQIGDTFNLNMAGNYNDEDDESVAFNHQFSFVATANSNPATLEGLRALIQAYITDELPAGTYSVNSQSAAAAAGYIEITGPVDIPFTAVGTTQNNGASADIFEFIAGQLGEADPGTWGNNLRVRAYPIGAVGGSNQGYKLDIFYKGYLVDNYVSAGSNWQTLIDQVNARCEWGYINPINLGQVLNLNAFDAQLTGGTYAAPTEEQFAPKFNDVTLDPEGLAIFEGVDVQIVACPEIFSANFNKVCDDWARVNRKFYAFNMPYLATEAVLETYYNALNTPDQSYSAGYLNWVEVPADNYGAKIWIPGLGYALGAGYIRKSGLNNGYVWIPPAGTETNAKGIFRITHDTLSDVTLSRYIKQWRCNVIKYIKNTGFCVWSSRTYSTNPLFESIHIRLETNWLVDNLLIRNEKFLQRLISPTMLKDQRVDNLIWFKNIYEQGGIEKSIPFDEAVIITVEQSRENRKETEMDIAWIPPETNEHIHIRLNRNDGIIAINF